MSRPGFYSAVGQIRLLACAPLPKAAKPLHPNLIRGCSEYLTIVVSVFTAGNTYTDMGVLRTANGIVVALGLIPCVHDLLRTERHGKPCVFPAYQEVYARLFS